MLCRPPASAANPTRHRARMFETICDLLPSNSDYPPRARKLDILRRVLDGTLYDALPYQFHEERGAGGEYIPLRSRRPSVRYALCRLVVENSISLLFSEGHFPTIDCEDRQLRAKLADLVKETRLNQIMTEAAIRGSVGSVAILMQVLRGRIFFSVLDTTYLDSPLGPRRTRHSCECNRKIQGCWRSTVRERVRRSRYFCDLLVHAQVG